MKITFWWRQTSGYFDACTRALVNAGHEVSVVYEAPTAEAPFMSVSERGFDHLADVRFWSGQPTRSLLAGTLNGATDLLVVSSWGVGKYVRESAAAPSSTLRLVGVDSPWRSSPRPIVGQFTHRRRLAGAFDGAWVTGAPQRQLVRRLGFRTAEIIEHLYCCDSHLFSPRHSAKMRFDLPFLFVGRLVDVKGLRPLGKAFQLFRQSTGSTRRLQIVGNGAIDVRGEGIDVLPFAEPPEVKALMDNSFALVHPAFLEHWGVVVHEAASMGLPLILGPSVHSGSRLLFDGINGFYADPEVEGLAKAMTALDQLKFESYERMSKASEHLGHLLNLESWTENLERGVDQLRRTKEESRI